MWGPAKGKVRKVFQGTPVCEMGLGKSVPSATAEAGDPTSVRHLQGAPPSGRKGHTQSLATVLVTFNPHNNPVR